MNCERCGHQETVHFRDGCKMIMMAASPETFEKTGQLIDWCPCKRFKP